MGKHSGLQDHLRPLAGTASEVNRRFQDEVKGRIREFERRIEDILADMQRRLQDLHGHATSEKSWRETTHKQIAETADMHVRSKEKLGDLDQQLQNHAVQHRDVNQRLSFIEDEIVPWAHKAEEKIRQQDEQLREVYAHINALREDR